MGLRAEGATVPQHQAVPMTRRDLLRLANAVSPRLKAALMLAWKCGGRWDEIQQLTQDQFVTISSERIIIAWGQKTKATRTQPFRPDMYTVVEGPWTSEIAAVLVNLRRNERLITTSTADLRRHMKAMFGNKYTAHSIKHGVANHLARLAAEGRLTMEQVQRVLKHKEVTTTLRYVSDRHAAAMALGTHQVTAML